jgi:hypothetical protein
LRSTLGEARLEPVPEPRQHRVRTRLTTIKLALALLRRCPELCTREHGPAEAAGEAADALAVELLRSSGEQDGRQLRLRRGS